MAGVPTTTLSIDLSTNHKYTSVSYVSSRAGIACLRTGEVVTARDLRR